MAIHPCQQGKRWHPARAGESFERHHQRLLNQQLHRSIGRVAVALPRHAVVVHELAGRPLAAGWRAVGQPPGVPSPPDAGLDARLRAAFRRPGSQGEAARCAGARGHGLDAR